MRSVILEGFQDETTGEIGLGLLGMPRDETTNVAPDGLTIAHDLLEHVNGPERIGTIDDELEALGAMWYIRGQTGQLRRDGWGSAHSAEEHLAADVMRMFRDHIDGAHVSFLKWNTRPCQDEDAIECILEIADRGYLDEFYGDEEKPVARQEWPAYREQCLHRMRTGYRAARRRWERHGQYAANNQFWAIAEAVNPYAKCVEVEGQRFKLTYGNGEARCEEVFEDEY